MHDEKQSLLVMTTQNSISSWFKIVLLLLMIVAGGNCAMAINIKTGVYYFDNSKQRYSSVRFIAGKTSAPQSRAYVMTPEPGTKLWKLTIDEDYNSVDYYAFVCSTVAGGDYSMTCGALLDSLYRNDANFRRTKTLNSFNLDESETWIFCPESEQNYCDGYWRKSSSYDATISGTLPVVYLNTQDSVSIITKEHYINGNLWIDCENIEGYESLGTAQAPLTIEAKGRGNWSWNHSFKKPYKVKFATKQTPLGLDKSRHFILHAHYSDYSGYLRNTTGYEISRLLNMPYTPTEVPVELVLNGEYRGLYFLCEKIRVESGRVDIHEQRDEETILDNVTGGWLLELTDDGDTVISQYQNNDPSNSYFYFVSRSPEVLSTVQRNYIHDLLYRGDSCIYATDKNDRGWELIFDLSTAARFYITHEIMENVEAYSGSLFLFKDLGWDEKLKFGPVWDFDNSFNQNTTSDHFVYEYDRGFPFLWIKEMLKFPRFQQEIRRVWREFMSINPAAKLTNHIWQWRSIIEVAEQQDLLRWPTYAASHAPERPALFVESVTKKIAWLDAIWGNTADVNCDNVVNAADVTALYSHILNGDNTFIDFYDVNGDGVINAADVTAVYNIILGN